MNVKKKVAMYLLGLILMGIGFICYFYQDSWSMDYPYQTIGIPLIFIGIAIVVIWLLADVLGRLDKI
jgi:vacuolar-type H+-ATPase subunit I/STV1